MLVWKARSERRTTTRSKTRCPWTSFSGQSSSVLDTDASTTNGSLLSSCWASFRSGLHVPEEYQNEYIGALTGRHYIVAPYFTPDGKVETYKLRMSDGSAQSTRIRAWSCKKDTYLTTLYGNWRAQDNDTVIVCEGETDTWATAWEFREDPIDVVGLPTGAKYPRHDWLLQFEGRMVVLLFDGRDSESNEVSPRTAQSWRVSLESKGASAVVVPMDANTDACDLLVAGTLRDVVETAIASYEPPEKTDDPEPQPEKEAKRRFTVVSAEDLIHAPPPSYQVDGHFVENSIAVLYGPAGSYKSFLALDIACSVAMGVPWLDHKVQQCPVVYVAAEGRGGLGKRLTAWKIEAEQLKLNNLYIVPETVNLTDMRDVSDTRELIASTQDVNAGLVVLDTLARCFHGDENSSDDMGRAIESVDAIRRATGATVIVVHHSGKDATRQERGSSALRGAANTMVRIKTIPDGNGKGLDLSCDKQKDDEPFRTKSLYVVEFGNSIVLRPSPWSGSNDVSPVANDAGKMAILRSIWELGGRDDCTNSTLHTATNLASSTFHRKLRALVDNGFVVKEGDGKGATYALTDSGIEVLTPITPI